MKKFREIISFAIIAYISCIIVKIIVNKFLFDVEILRDSIFNAIGVTLGWYGGSYGYECLHKKITNKKNK